MNDAWKEEAEEDWDETHPRKLIPELCQLFYNLGWYILLYFIFDLLFIHL